MVAAKVSPSKQYLTTKKQERHEEQGLITPQLILPYITAPNVKTMRFGLIITAIFTNA
jgi:hypothetical protein